MLAENLLKRVLILMLFTMTFSAIAQGQSWSDPAAHTARFVNVGSGVKIEVLDWGGSGPPLLLLAGHGDTGHVFDDFAPDLVGKFHVIAMTRRGFGASTQPATDYALATMVSDIAHVMDALDIPRAHFVGHSIAGDEITKFAATYPERIGKIVYLDAAYDRVEARALEGRFPRLPDMGKPTAKDLSSPANLRAFVAKGSVLLPESEIRASRIWAADGHFERARTPDNIQSAVATMVEHPDYKRIKAPVLAIYAVPQSPADLFPRYSYMDEDGQRSLRAIFELWQAFAATQRNLLRAELPSAKVVEIAGGNHYLFISNREQTIDQLLGFLQ